tara:strand:+ start:118 stop:876 length:759 start_codon:yes stop_codon:yes gene_type:complete
MRGWLKWIAALIGFSIFGFWGALIGYAIGSMLDTRGSVEWDEKYTSDSQYSAGQVYQRTGTGDFASSLLVLTAAVMKADGKVLKSELDYVKRFFIRQFGEQKAQEQMKALRDLIKMELNLREVSHNVRYQMQYAGRLQLLHYLFGIAQADQFVSEPEQNTIQRIAGMLGIGNADFESIKAMFVRNTGADYRILEVTQDASDEELKQAYRKMAKKYHPDKVSHLGEDVRRQAEEKFRKVQEAYENLKKERAIV